jgi:single-stranded DNA-binding protein
MVRRVISIARHWTDNEGRLIEDYDDFELSSWGQVAEKIIEIQNGALVRVKGRVKVERWTDGAETKSAVRIAAENVQVLCF